MAHFLKNRKEANENRDQNEIGSRSNRISKKRETVQV
jgi:hypothetical protein